MISILINMQFDILQYRLEGQKVNGSASCGKPKVPNSGPQNLTGVANSSPPLQYLLSWRCAAGMCAAN